MTEQTQLQQVHTTQGTAVDNLSLPVAVLVLLQDEAPLLSVYTKLIILDYAFGLEKLISSKLAGHLGISEQHQGKLIKQLESLGLVKKKHTGREVTLQLTVPQKLLTDEQVRKLFTMKKNVHNEDDLKNIDLLGKNLVKISKVPDQESLTLPYNIYTNTLNISNTNNSNVNTKGDHLKIPKKRNDNIKRFPKIQYNQVLMAYKQISGTDRRGSELKTALNYTRSMFLAGRTPKEIISFMEWIEENKDEKKFEWLKFWTMGTVQKWLPDFLSGRLTNEEEEDDGYRRLN